MSRLTRRAARLCALPFALAAVCAPPTAALADSSTSLAGAVSSTVSVPSGVTVATPDPSQAVTNALVDWSTLLPGLTDAYSASDPNLCNSGHNSCVAAVLKEMDRRLAPLEAACSHNAMFALLYDHITRSYYDTVLSDPTFFHDNAFVNHEDAVFASYYFNAYDQYAAGNRSAVPQAWQIALDAAASHSVTGLGNILLGVNAHIQRDLPYVLYHIGLTEPDGTPLKPDHDLVNQILYGAFGDAITDASAHLDPTVNPNFPPSLQPLGYATLFQAVEGWREEAFRFAAQLAAAPDAAARQQVADAIEQNAANTALLIRAGTAYGPLSSSASRDAFCATHQPGN